MAWMNMLRLQLRRHPVFNTAEYRSSEQLKIIRDVHGEQDFEQQLDEILKNFILPEERPELKGKTNIAASILKTQNETLIHIKNQKWLDEYEHSDMSKIVQELFNHQGACERIKSFPFPRQYANFSFVFVYIFIALLPFAMINDLDRMGKGTSWLVIPFTMLIAWVFNVMEQVGDASENPFDNGINDIPMTAICRNVEIEFRELLGEPELPPRVQPVKGIIM